jgi:hypothetical protein
MSRVPPPSGDRTSKTPPQLLSPRAQVSEPDAGLIARAQLYSNAIVNNFEGQVVASAQGDAEM